MVFSGDAKVVRGWRNGGTQSLSWLCKINTSNYKNIVFSETVCFVSKEANALQAKVWSSI